MSDTTRARLEKIAALLDDAHRELKTLPAGPAIYQATKTVETAASQLRVAHARTPDEQPRHRASKRVID
jgi:hypothetical protein